MYNLLLHFQCRQQKVNILYLTDSEQIYMKNAKLHDFIKGICLLLRITNKNKSQNNILIPKSSSKNLFCRNILMKVSCWYFLFYIKSLNENMPTLPTTFHYVLNCTIYKSFIRFMLKVENNLSTFYLFSTCVSHRSN